MQYVRIDLEDQHFQRPLLTQSPTRKGADNGSEARGRAQCTAVCISKILVAHNNSSAHSGANVLRTVILPLSFDGSIHDFSLVTGKDKGGSTALRVETLATLIRNLFSGVQITAMIFFKSRQESSCYGRSI